MSEEEDAAAIGRKSAFRNAMERASLSPAVWVGAVLVLVVVAMVFSK